MGQFGPKKIINFVISPRENYFTKIHKWYTILMLIHYILIYYAQIFVIMNLSIYKGYSIKTRLHFLQKKKTFCQTNVLPFPNYNSYSELLLVRQAKGFLRRKKNTIEPRALKLAQNSRTQISAVL